MCTYATSQSYVAGSAKGPNGGWFRVSRVTTYFDHPVHTLADHTLNLDFADPELGPAARVAVELTADSARLLVDDILTALGGVPSSLSNWSSERMHEIPAD
jgi:hypothetical protein